MGWERGQTGCPWKQPTRASDGLHGAGGGGAVSEDPPSQGLCPLPPAASTGGGPELQLCPLGCPESPALTLADTGVPGAAPPKTCCEIKMWARSPNSPGKKNPSQAPASQESRVSSEGEVWSEIHAYAQAEKHSSGSDHPCGRHLERAWPGPGHPPPPQTANVWCFIANSLNTLFSHLPQQETHRLGMGIKMPTAPLQASPAFENVVLVLRALARVRY